MRLSRWRCYARQTLPTYDQRALCHFKPVIFNLIAVMNIDEIAGDIAQDNIVAAADLRLAVYDTAESLSQHTRSRLTLPRQRAQEPTGG